MKPTYLLFIFYFVLLIPMGLTKNYQVETLNRKDKESMAFYPMILNVNVGDEVTFVPTSKGHNSQSVYLPQKANAWKGKVSKEVKVKFTHEGIYLYECQNHGIMGMVGVIQVGNPVNLKKAKDFYQKYKNKFVMNKDRLDQFFDPQN